MTTKPRIIAEDVLLPTHFLSATEQEGVYLGQPEPDDDNSGNLRPISVGDDFTSMVLDATLASGPQDSHFNAVGFDIYGNDYFIGCTMKASKQFEDSGDIGHKVVGHEALSVSDVKKFGNNVIDFDGSASFISIAHSANWCSLQTSFSIDLWVKHTDHIGVEVYMSQYEDTNNYWQFLHTHANGLRFIIFSGGVAIVATPGGLGEITDTNWHHLLMAKVANEYGIYKDGIQISYLDDASMAIFTGPLYIGQQGGGDNYFDGQMDDIRIYHGNPLNAAPNVGLTDTITIPTAAHSLDGTGNTRLLLDGDVAERTISDFRQTDGKITVSPAFSASLTTGEAFQIIRDKDDVDFRLVLVASGDVGDSKFKWSHDGGSNYMGRHDPYQANWASYSPIATLATAQTGSTVARVTQAIDDSIIMVYQTDIFTTRGRVMKSVDKGRTWTEIGEYSTTLYGFPQCLIKLKSGRLLLGTNGATDYILYSDNNGETWNVLSILAITNGPSDIIELFSGNVLMVYYQVSGIYCKISSDGGVTWGSAKTIATDANTQQVPAVCQAKNGDIVCSYESDEDAVNDFEIKCKISSDGGITWGSAISVINISGPAGNDIGRPSLLKDIDGSLLCSGVNKTTTQTIYLSQSLDNGATWASDGYIGLFTDAARVFYFPCLTLIDGHIILCTFTDTTADAVMQMRAGWWGMYFDTGIGNLEPNLCPTAIESIEQSLICDAKVKWAGYAGIGSLVSPQDKWDFSPEYYFAKENLLLDSPSQPWRSEQDNIEVSIVIDLETSKGYPFDSIGLFGCNVRTLKIQASPVNETKVWVLPPIDEEISFDVDTTGIIDSVVNNYIEDAALLANYKDHELRNHYIQMTNGPDNGQTYKIIDNIGDWFEVLSAETIRAIVGNTFTIFKTDISAFFINPDTTNWADLGSLEISGSNNQVEDQDIVNNLYLSGSAASNNLARLIVGGDATLSTNSHDNCITGLQCAGTITDHGTDNVIEEGGWHNYPYRYIRILIEAQDTYEGYYQVGNTILGKYTELSRNWRVGYNLDSNFGIEMIRTPHGGLSTIRKHNEIKKFNLSWHQVDDTNTELTKLIDYIGGKNVCLIPDSDSPNDCYLTKFTGSIKRRHILLDRFDTSLVMEEVK